MVALVRLDRDVVLDDRRDVRESAESIADRQTWLIAVHGWRLPRLSVALSAARRERRAHGNELAGHGKFVSRGSTENSEGSDKWEWLREIGL
jgi:hypothetical protein